MSCEVTMHTLHLWPVGLSAPASDGSSNWCKRPWPWTSDHSPVDSCRRGGNAKPLHARDPPTTQGLIEPHGHWREVVMAKEIHCSSVLCEIISPYTSQKDMISPDLEGRVLPSLTNYHDFLHLCAGRSDNQFAVCFWFKTQDAHEALEMEETLFSSLSAVLRWKYSSSSSPLVLLCFDL